MFHSVKVKLILFFSILVAFATIASLIATTFIVDDAQNDRAMDSAIRTEQVITALRESAVFNMEIHTQIATSQPLLTIFLEDEDQAQLSGIAQSYQEDFKADIVSIRNRHRQPLANIGDQREIDNKAVFEKIYDSVLSGNKVSTIVTFNHQPALVNFAPIGSPDSPVGILTIGRLWNDNFFHYVKSLTKAEISFFTNGNITSSSLSKSDRKRFETYLKSNYFGKAHTNAFFTKTDDFLIKVSPVKDYRQAIVGYMIIQHPRLEEKMVQENINKLLLTIGVVIMIIAILLGYGTANSLVKPLRKLQSNAEAIAKGNLNQEIDSHHKDEVGKLAKSFAIMRDAIKNQIDELQTLNHTIQEQNETLEHKVIARTASIKDLLDNAGQGFLSFSADYKIHSEYSRACDQFFGKSIRGENVLKLLFSSNEAAVKESLDLLFGGVGELAIFEDLLPGEIEMEGRTLTVHYRWIPSTLSTESDKMMIILTDVTKAKALEQQLAVDEARNKLILKIATDRDGFSRFLSEAKTLFQAIYQQLQQPIDRIDQNGLFRHYHTLKGGTASYALHEVSEAVHNIESNLDGMMKNPSLFTKKSKTQLQKSTQQAESMLIEAVKPLRDLVDDSNSCSKAEKVFKVSESKINKLERYTGNLLEKAGDKRLLALIRDLKKQPIGGILNKFKNDAQDLAQKLNKQVEIELSGQDVEIDQEPLQPLFASLVHLVRNSVDHGIEDPDVRIMQGKEESGKLFIQAEMESNHFHLRIKDDGAGIDGSHIKDIALSKNLITDSQHREMDPDEAVRLIFLPGFSTKEAVTDISGRGVGMDAVQTAISELKGEIHILTTLDHGSEFLIQIPTT